MAREPGFGIDGQLVTERAGPAIDGGGKFVGDGGGGGGVRWAQVRSCPASIGKVIRCGRPCRTLAMDRAPSIGAAVIWSMRALMPWPASWAARSRWYRAWREGSRW